MNKKVQRAKHNTALTLLGQATAWISFSFRKVMIEYVGKKERTERSDVLMDFIRRIEANSTGIRVLVTNTIKSHYSVYLKLPMGLLLRSCLVDSIQGLYLSLLSELDFKENIRNINLDYVNSLRDRFEVYQDRFEEEALFIDELKSTYGMSIEDSFPDYIDWGEINKITKHFIIAACHRASLSSMIKSIKNNEQYRGLALKLNGYYRKYSQYEHFSQMGHGDSLVPFDDEWPLMAKAYEYVSKAALEIIKNLSLPIMSFSEIERASKEIKTLCS